MNERDRLAPVLRAVCELLRDYREYWDDLDQNGKAYRLPPSLHGALERLDDLVKVAGLTLDDIDGVAIGHSLAKERVYECRRESPSSQYHGASPHRGSVRAAGNHSQEIIQWVEYEALQRERDMWEENYDRVSEHLKAVVLERNNLHG